MAINCDEASLVSGQAYSMKAISWTFRENRDGRPYLEITFQVGEHRPKHFMSMDRKNMTREIEVLRALGWQGTEFNELFDNGGGLDSNEVRGIVVEKRTEQGRVYWNVQTILLRADDEARARIVEFLKTLPPVMPPAAVDARSRKKGQDDNI